jgi:hypothetical protein
MSVAVEVCSESTIGVNRIDEFSEVVHSYLSIKSIPEVQDRCTKEGERRTGENTELFVSPTFI